MITCRISVLSKLALFFLATSLFSLSGCAQVQTSNELGCKSSRFACLNNTAIVMLETDRGVVLIQLDGKNAPLTAGNFADLVKRGVYNGTLFHRVIRTPLPFVVQGGDPGTANPKVPPAAYGTGNFIDPVTGEARFIPLEFKIESRQGELVYARELASPSVLKKPVLLHERGSLAMARSEDPNSASSQFYIALKPLPELDGRYAVFGKVIRGLDVVDRLQQGDKLIRARLVSVK
jgi:peptidyl-prolyl cis-trans isomerase B (cyclophilin B)